MPFSKKILNHKFKNWSGDYPDNWIFIQKEDENNYITEDSSGCRIVSSDKNMGIARSLLSNGSTYRIGITLWINRGQGLEIISGNTSINSINSNGTYWYDFVADTSTLILKNKSKETDFVIESILVKQKI